MVRETVCVPGFQASGVVCWELCAETAGSKGENSQTPNRLAWQCNKWGHLVFRANDLMYLHDT